MCQRFLFVPFSGCCCVRTSSKERNKTSTFFLILILFVSCIAIHMFLFLSVHFFLPYLQTIHFKRLFVFKKQTKETKKNKHYTYIHIYIHIIIISIFLSDVIMSNIDEERQLLSERLSSLSTDQLHSFDLELTLLRTAFESYKRETVFKPCPTFLVGLTDEQLVSVNEYLRKEKTFPHPHFLATSLSSTTCHCFPVDR